MLRLPSRTRQVALLSWRLSSCTRPGPTGLPAHAAEGVTFMCRPCTACHFRKHLGYLSIMIS